MHTLCPNVLTLAASSLDTRLRGSLFLAVQMDPDHSCFPLGVGIDAGNETAESWTYFMEHLRNAVPTISAETVFVSGPDKGLAKAVPAVFPASAHRFCLHHLRNNIKVGKLGEAVTAFVNAAAKSQTLSAFEKLLAGFEKTAPTAATLSWIRSIPPKNLCRAFITSRTYDIWTNNLAERVNSSFKEFCCRPIDELVCEIVNWSATRSVNLRDRANAWSSRPTDYID